MASIHQRKNGMWHLSFRFGGSQFNPSLRTKSEREAERALAIADDTLSLMEKGRIAPPNPSRDAIIHFVLSGGKARSKLKVVAQPTLQQVAEEYFASYTVGKEPVSLTTERVHIRHFQRLIGGRRRFASVDTAMLQDYAAKRSEEPGQRGRKVSGATIGKELTTFDQIWKVAIQKQYVEGPSPTKGVKLALVDEKSPFKTWAEIEAIIVRGGLTANEQKEYWDCLFLDERQVLEFLEFIREKPEQRFLHAALSLAAFSPVNETQARGENDE